MRKLGMFVIILILAFAFHELIIEGSSPASSTVGQGEMKEILIGLQREIESLRILICEERKLTLDGNRVTFGAHPFPGTTGKVLSCSSR